MSCKTKPRAPQPLGFSFRECDLPHRHLSFGLGRFAACSDVEVRMSTKIWAAVVAVAALLNVVWVAALSWQVWQFAWWFF